MLRDEPRLPPLPPHHAQGSGEGDHPEGHEDDGQGNRFAGWLAWVEIVARNEKGMMMLMPNVTLSSNASPELPYRYTTLRVVRTSRSQPLRWPSISLK